MAETDGGGLRVSETDTLDSLPTAALIEAYGQTVRYRDRLERAVGATQYLLRCAALKDLLVARGVDPEDVATEPPPPKPCRVQPLADFVIVQPIEAEAISAGGIIRPDSAKEVPMQGTVLAVGPGAVLPGVGTKLPAVKPGDVVLFGRYAGVEATVDEQVLRIMREDDLLGILLPEPA